MFADFISGDSRSYLISAQVHAIVLARVRLLRAHAVSYEAKNVYSAISNNDANVRCQRQMEIVERAVRPRTLIRTIRYRNAATDGEIPATRRVIDESSRLIRYAKQLGCAVPKNAKT